MNAKINNDLVLKKPAIPWQGVLLGGVGISLGVWLAVTAIPTWLPNLASSLYGASPKAFWYLSRGSAFASFALIWLSMVMGLGISNKMARHWPGALQAYDLHEYFSLMGLGFGLFHALILIGDRFINYNLAQIALPFASINYKPFPVGLGQLAFYLSVLVSITFYLRRQIGQKGWRLIHFASYAAFVLVLIHGIASGTDSGSIWAIGVYALSGLSVLFLTIYRIATAGKAA